MHSNNIRECIIRENVCLLKLPLEGSKVLADLMIFSLTLFHVTQQKKLSRAEYH